MSIARAVVIRHCRVLIDLADNRPAYPTTAFAASTDTWNRLWQSELNALHEALNAANPRRRQVNPNDRYTENLKATVEQLSDKLEEFSDEAQRLRGECRKVLDGEGA
jgi:TRAP-type C4-dicarboxylate transport system substrate-binding protein